MTPFCGDSLLVSLPGIEVGRMSLPGSLAEPDAVLANPLSLELRAALEILHQEAQHRGLPILCVARPELFTHGLSEAWLQSRISPSAQHVCLSDGTAVKHLPGLPTHVFFYCLSSRDSTAALRRLSRRAPELVTNLRSQVNTCVTLGPGPDRVRPDPVYVSRTMPLQHPPSTLLPFFLNWISAEDSVSRIEQAGPVLLDSLVGFARMLYLPLTETALDDRAFTRAITDLILRIFFDPTTLLVLRLPTDPQVEPSLIRGIETLLAAFHKTGVLLPRASPANILFTIQDLEEDHVIFDRLPLHIVLPESFDFWRHTVGFYARAAEVTVLAEPSAVAEASFFRFDLSALYGAKAVRRWIVDPAGSD